MTGLGDESQEHFEYPNVSIIIYDKFVGTTTFTTVWKSLDKSITNRIDYNLILNKDGSGILEGEGHDTSFRIKVKATPLKSSQRASNSDTLNVVFVDYLYDVKDPDKKFEPNSFLFQINYGNEKYIINAVNHNYFEISNDSEGIHEFDYSLWKDFTFKGKPIHPYCILGYTVYAKTGFNLSECVIDDTEAEVPRFEDGYLKYPGNSKFDDETFRAYSEYKVVAQVGNIFIISSYVDGGGSGGPNSLLLIKKEGDLITLKEIASGQGCGSGVFGGVLKNNNKLEYGRNLSFNLMMEGIYGVSLDFKIYDLSWKTNDCTNVVGHYEYNIDSTENSLVSLEGLDSGDGFLESGQTKMDGCLIDVLAPYFKKDKFIYKKDFNAIKSSFESKCVKK
jgi:hypothetical protein